MLIIRVNTLFVSAKNVHFLNSRMIALEINEKSTKVMNKTRLYVFLILKKKDQARSFQTEGIIWGYPKYSMHCFFFLHKCWNVTAAATCGFFRVTTFGQSVGYNELLL